MFTLWLQSLQTVRAFVILLDRLMCMNGAYKQLSPARVIVYVGMCVSQWLERLEAATMWPEDWNFSFLLISVCFQPDRQGSAPNRESAQLIAAVLLPGFSLSDAQWRTDASALREAGQDTESERRETVR